MIQSILDEMDTYLVTEELLFIFHSITEVNKIISGSVSAERKCDAQLS